MMAYKIMVNQPNLAPGTEVFIDGLGTFENGKEQIVSAEQINHFRNAHGHVDDAGQWVQGPTLSQAGIVGLTAERVSDNPDGGTVAQTPAPTKKKEGDK
jgi:hypothetical protein